MVIDVMSVGMHKLLAFLMLPVRQSEHWNKFGILDLKNKKGDLKPCNFFRNWRQMEVLQLEIFFFFLIIKHLFHAISFMPNIFTFRFEFPTYEHVSKLIKRLTQIF